MPEACTRHTPYPHGANKCTSVFQQADTRRWRVTWQYGGYGTYTPYTHVAIVAGNGVKDGQIYVITQNPDASVLKWFPTAGLLGYLHPHTIPKPDVDNPTGDNNEGYPDTERGGAWIHWQGDNLYLHETDNSGARTRVFYRTTADNFSEKTSQGNRPARKAKAPVQFDVTGKLVCTLRDWHGGIQPTVGCGGSGQSPRHRHCAVELRTAPASAQQNA